MSAPSYSAPVTPTPSPQAVQLANVQDSIRRSVSAYAGQYGQDQLKAAQASYDASIQKPLRAVAFTSDNRGGGQQNNPYGLQIGRR
jgi:hypothetical protein